MATKIEKRICNYCNEPIKGRADKKFCDDQCRSHYNNRIRIDENNMRNINNILRKNRRVMADLLGEAAEGKRTVPLKKLSDMGFNFTYHTHTYTTQKGGTYKFCYELGYLKLDNDFYMIVKRDEP
jgi:hypothetical protein